MRCLRCGKEIKETKPKELAWGWHVNCIKSFFGVDTIPEICLEEEELMKVAVEGVRKGQTVQGVQKKLSLSLDQEEEDRPRLTVIDYPAGYILKPQADGFANLPELEHMAMGMAEKTKISVVPHGLVKDAAGNYAYITKRIDRVDDQLFAMEDFCQLGERITADKYKGSYEKCGKIIDNYSSRPMLDKTEFFLRLVFCFAIGNSDMHLKNFSLIEKEPKSRIFILTDAYDLLPVNIAMPEDPEEMALALNGKKSRLKRKDFEALGKNLGLKDKVIQNMMEKVISLENVYIQECRQSLLPEDTKERMEELVKKRIETLREV